MSSRLETLILPTNQIVDKSWIQVAVLDRDRRQPRGRTKLAKLEEYRPLLDKKLFQPYEPPPPPPPPRVVAVPTTQPTVKPEAVAPPPPPPPPKDSQMVLGRLLSSPRGQVAVLEPPKPSTGPDEYKEIGEEMFGGTLIFVHPQGAVTERDGERRFHAIGDVLQNCKPFTEQEQPLVFHDLLKLETRTAGIKPGPG